jgi:hypothetical protein
MMPEAKVRFTRLVYLRGRSGSFSFIPLRAITVLGFVSQRSIFLSIIYTIQNFPRPEPAWFRHHRGSHLFLAGIN